MDGPLVAFDVSKGSSHLQGFLSPGNPLAKAKVISHDSGGFEAARKIFAELKEKTGKEPVAAYESTGVYSRSLERFLISEGIKRIVISPLESAKFRKAKIRPTKNDSLDCRSIAGAVYEREHAIAWKEDPKTAQLRYLLCEYIHSQQEMVRSKNWHMRNIDDFWPGFSDLADPFSQKSLKLVEKFGCPQNIRSREAIEKALEKTPKQSRNGFESYISAVWDYVQKHRTGEIPEYAAEKAEESAAEVVKRLEKVGEIFACMEKIASEIPGTALLETIPGIGKRLAVRLIASIGDIARFPKAKSLVAYAGIDPMVLQSGQQTGDHLHITKKGNACLRATLYEAVQCIRKSDPDGMTASYVDRKIKDGHPRKAAVIAGCSKLVRLIHAMLRTGTCYNPK